MSRVLQGYWAENMLKCVQNHTESPDRFIQWASYSVLGAVMKRKFFFKSGLFTLYPNQYIVLISPPGVGKGTAIQFVWDLIRGSTPPLANIIPDRVTAPKIIQRIADGWSAPPSFVGLQISVGQKEHSCTIFSTELSMLAGASDQMLDFLCEGWDRNEYEYDTKNCGSSRIKDMCLSLIGATVPDFIQHIDRNRNMPIRGGFTSRCIFVYEDKEARQMLHPPPIESNPTSRKLLADLKNDLMHIAQLSGGEFKYSPAAEVIFDQFVTSQRATSADDIDAIQFFKSRIQAHILKLSMVLAISRSDTLMIEDVDMYNAVQGVEAGIKTLERVFRGSGDSNIAVATGHVMNYVERQGAVSKRDILRHLHRHLDADTLDRVLYTMTEIGHFYTVTSGRTVLYRVQNGTSPNGKVKP